MGGNKMINEDEKDKLLNNLLLLKEKLLSIINFFKKVTYGMLLMTVVNLALLIYILARNI